MRKSADLLKGTRWHAGCSMIRTMRRLISLSLLALTLTSGVALADRDRRDRHDHRDRDRGRGRDRDRWERRDRGPVVRDHHHHRERRRIDRRPIYFSGGRYTFHGGVSRVYHRPVVRQRYYDYRVRPTVIVENMEPVPGYVWVAGRWNWNGREWIWMNGHYAPDTRYSVWYDDDTYETAPGVSVSGGISVGF